MKYTSIPFVGGFYADETKPFSVQDCLNYLPEQAEQPGTRTSEKLKTPPGLREFGISYATFGWKFVYGNAPLSTLAQTQNPRADTANSRLLAAGQDNFVYQSVGGITWYQLGVAVPAATLWKVSSITGGLIALGFNGSAGQLYKSTDSGATWSNVPTAAGSYVETYGTSIIATNDNAGTSYAYISGDSGSTWLTLTFPSGTFQSNGGDDKSFTYIQPWDQWIIPSNLGILLGSGVNPTALNDAGVVTTIDIITPSSVAYSPELDMAILSGPKDRVYVKQGKTGTWTQILFSSALTFNVFEMCWVTSLQQFVGNAENTLVYSSDGLAWSTTPIYVGTSTVTSGSHQGCSYLPWTGQICLSTSTQTGLPMLVSTI